MSKSELLRLLAPFTDEVELRAWNGTIWAPITAEAKYSPRSGRTTVYVRPDPEQGLTGVKVEPK